jgi:tetratricopeptide (TPR) repeat protein
MKRSYALALLLLLTAWDPWHSTNRDVEAGNQAFNHGDYDAALEAYDRAAKDGEVDPDGLAYDRGTAEIRKGEAAKDPQEHDKWLQKGMEDLKQAAQSKDPKIAGNAQYNRGNALSNQEQWDDAIEAYKQAIHDQPNNDDASINLELALKHRKKEQMQQQGGQGQGQQGQHGQHGQHGHGQQGQGQQGQGQQGQGQQGQGQQGQNPGQGSNGQGSNGQGSNWINKDCLS